MKKLLVAALLLVMSANVNIFAQESGYKAILFQFDGLSLLRANAFDGGVGAKYYLNNRMAVRGVVQFTMASSVTPWTGAAAGNDGESSVTTIGVGAAFEYHMVVGKLSPYFGGGFGFRSVTSEEKSPYANGGSQTVIKDDPAYNAGTNLSLYALLGVEYYIYDNVSLAAEYRLGFNSLSRADYSITSGGITSTSKMGSMTSIGTGSQGLFTLAFYW